MSASLPVSALRSFAFGLLLLLGWACLAPGLAGGFLFDDHVALPVLGATGAVDDWPTFWRYITSGTSDPTGRPLALLSFLADARDWPAGPAPFLLSNLLLHLLNATLLYRLLLRMGRELGTPDDRNAFAALVAAGLWLLHPLHVSTVFYVIQREAVLCTTFVFSGLLAYARGRAMAASMPRRGLAWMAGGICLGTVLAVLSKANGVLLPVLAATLEATVFGTTRHPGGEHRIRVAKLVLLAVPALLLLLYMATVVPSAAAANDRPWSIAQRLLTEPRVLFDYLRVLVVPRVLSSGLYNDGYPVSNGLLDPPSTALAIAALGVLAVSAVVLRRRVPALSAAVLFFFAGHLLESTVVPLELYFEHRNYLPSALLFWPLARACATWRPAAARAAAIVMLALFGFLAWQRAALWAQPEKSVALWAASQPDSSRAQASMAIYEVAHGRADLAIRRIAPLWAQHPMDLQLAVSYIDAVCANGLLAEADARRMGDVLRTAPEGGALVHGWLSAWITGESSCHGVDDRTIGRWLAAAAANPMVARFPGRRQDLQSLLGMHALRRGDGRRAEGWFDMALEASPTPETAAFQAAMLGEHGFPRRGLRHLSRYQRLAGAKRPAPSLNMSYVHALVLRRQGYWDRELASLRAALSADARAGQEDGG